ncbi:MAG: hypothetical protein AUJ21_03485 [Anaerolineae bacterium CG1_02_58_13]|nr:MAG: hypothetical protein AUJ21_03485 [Anaerolineae bacterium CG1_02_58_13]
MSKLITKRILIFLVIGIVVGAAISEITFLFLRETGRAPKEILLTIPAGTAEQVARGEQPPALPENMIFVVGDVLTVKNEDAVDHQMGPLWIPAGASAHLALAVEENLAYECSFQSTKYIGLDVRKPVTLGTRLYGILYAGIPLGVLLALYSFIMPARKKQP